MHTFAVRCALTPHHPRPPSSRSTYIPIRESPRPSPSAAHGSSVFRVSSRGNDASSRTRGRGRGVHAYKRQIDPRSKPKQSQGPVAALLPSLACASTSFSRAFTFTLAFLAAAFLLLPQPNPFAFYYFLLLWSSSRENRQA